MAPSPESATGDEKNKPVFVEPATLTFSGLAPLAGLLMNIFSVDTAWLRIAIGAVIAVLIGGFLTYLALTDPKAMPKDSREKNIAIAVGMVNTIILFASTVGVASIETGAE